MAKAKQTKHTSAELAAKAKAALTNKGGGTAGMKDRQGGKAGHAKYKCFVCSVQARPPASTLDPRRMPGLVEVTGGDRAHAGCAAD